MTSPDRITLSDGRSLDVRITGPDNGLPLVFHHGTPSAAVKQGGFERAATAHGIRMIVTSRPGYGGSTRNPGRSVVDVVADTDELLDALGIESCVVAGWSGGGPHALACAARLDRALATVVIAGVAPHEAPGLEFLAGMGQDNIDEFGAAESGEAALRPYLDEQRIALANTDAAGIIAGMTSLLPAADQAVLTDEFGEDMAAAFAEALRTGVDGWLDDDFAFVKPWGFDLSEIASPVALWQGSDDLMVPFAHGKWLAANVPGASVHLLEGEGHLSVALGSLDEMLDELVAAAR